MQLFDACANVETVRNGLLCSMHPSEGFWIFKGAQNRALGANSYGISWSTAGSGETTGMPTSVIRVHHNPRQAGMAVAAAAAGKTRNDALARAMHHAVVSTSDSPCIVRVNTVEQVGGGGGQDLSAATERDTLYQFFDEQYLSHLSTKSMGWPRDRGIVELIPIVVGMGVV